MRINIKKNLEIFQSNFSVKKVFFFLYLLIIPLFFFSAGCISGSRSYYQTRPSTRKYHIIRKGETLYSISRRYNVSVKELIQHNRIKNIKEIEPGRKIYLPSSKKRYHIVKKGETLYSISRKHKVSVKRLIAYNRIKSSKAIDPGQRIYLPSDKKISSYSYKRRKTYPKSKISTIKFIWPLKGKLTSKFGLRFGVPHKGIDIAASFGTKIVAAYDGEVALVESRPRGLGNVIILRHAKDYMTVYGHNSKILVKVKQKVKKGQSISLVGSSGWSTGPHLHFEIRYKGEAFDPLNYLP
ncbi:MAG: M23 family metallopeptidase [bacterium]